MPAWAAAERAVGMGELELPAAIAGDHGLELIHFIVAVVALMRVLRAGLAGYDRPDIQPVDLVLWQVRADQLCDGRKEIDGHQHIVADCACGYLAGPAHDARLARA